MMSQYNIRVIEIIDEYSIIINYGIDDGASEGDKIRIISIGPEVIDPETEELLGTLDFIKDVLTITTAYDKFSLCKKIETTTTNVLSSPLTQFNKITKEAKSINVDKKNISNKKFSNDKIIKIGDKVEIL